MRVKVAAGTRCEKLELLRESEHRPCEPTRPRRERREALLGARTAVRAVGDVEKTFVRDASAHVEWSSLVP